MHWEDLEGAGGEGGVRGIRMGNTCKPMAVSFQCMTKFTTNKKKKKEKKLRQIYRLDIDFALTFYCTICCASLVAQLVKNPPVMQETLVQFLGWEDLLEKG